LTYEVTGGAQAWIVRRPPLGHVLATAHDMRREFRVQSALAGSTVPVARMYALCTDPAVLGAPFYVMARVDGTTYRRASELEPLGPVRTRQVSAAFIDTLAALHAIDPADVGLADYGQPTGYLGRQVRRWQQQLHASQSRQLPLADELHARLVHRMPATATTAITHGDYRLDNLMIADERPVAVLDWEMATLGDPLADLALLAVYRRMERRLGEVTDPDTSYAPGFLTENEIFERYSAHTGADLSDFDFYLALAAYKVAAIHEGIYYRYLTGHTVGSGFDNIGDITIPLLEAGLESLG
jgi:aminoglycoside phosphotransferase (APT) family kinase protein